MHVFLAFSPDHWINNFLVWFAGSPKADPVIAACGSQHRTGWVPVNAPENFAVGVFDVVKPTVIDFPVTNLAFLASTGENVLLERVPLDALNVPFMALEVPNFVFEIADIEKLYFLVFGTGKEVDAIDWIPLCLLNRRVVDLELED